MFGVVGEDSKYISSARAAYINGLDPENRKKFESLSPDKQKALVVQFVRSNIEHTPETLGLAIEKTANPDASVEPTKRQLFILKQYDNISRRFNSAEDYQRAIDKFKSGEMGNSDDYRLVVEKLNNEMETTFDPEALAEARDPQKRQAELDARLLNGFAVRTMIEAEQAASAAMQKQVSEQSAAAYLAEGVRSLCSDNTAENVFENLTDYSKNLTELYGASQTMSQTDFNKKFYKTMERSYDPKLVRSFQEKDMKYKTVLANKSAMESFEKALTLDYSSENLTKLENLLGGTETIAKVDSSYSTMTDREKFARLKMVAKEGRQAVEKTYNENLNGKTFDDFRAEYASNRATFMEMMGAENVEKLVDDYCKAQEKGAGYVKLGATVVVAAGIGVLTGGTGLLAGAAIGAGSGLAVEVADRATNGKKGDLSTTEAYKELAVTGGLYGAFGAANTGIALGAAAIPAHWGVKFAAGFGGNTAFGLGSASAINKYTTGSWAVSGEDVALTTAFSMVGGIPALKAGKAQKALTVSSNEDAPVITRRGLYGKPRVAESDAPVLTETSQPASKEPTPVVARTIFADEAISGADDAINLSAQTSVNAAKSTVVHNEPSPIGATSETIVNTGTTEAVSIGLVDGKYVLNLPGGQKTSIPFVESANGMNNVSIAKTNGKYSLALGDGQKATIPASDAMAGMPDGMSISIKNGQYEVSLPNGIEYGGPLAKVSPENPFGVSVSKQNGAYSVELPDGRVVTFEDAAAVTPMAKPEPSVIARGNIIEEPVVTREPVFHEAASREVIPETVAPEVGTSKPVATSKATSNVVKPKATKLEVLPESVDRLFITLDDMPEGTKFKCAIGENKFAISKRNFGLNIDVKKGSATTQIREVIIDEPSAVVCEINGERCLKLRIPDGDVTQEIIMPYDSLSAKEIALCPEI